MADRNVTFSKKNHNWQEFLFFGPVKVDSLKPSLLKNYNNI